MKPSSIRDDAEQAVQTDEWSPSSSDSGIRSRVAWDELDRERECEPEPAERATVVFRGMFPIEGLVHFIRRHAQERFGRQALSAKIEAPDPSSWQVSLQLAEVVVIGRATDPFVATLRAFDLLT